MKQSRDPDCESSSRSGERDRRRTGRDPESAPRRPTDGEDVGSRAADLQRRHGNQAVQELLEAGVQPKLTVSEPSDRREREADRVAETVVGSPEPDPVTDVQRNPSGERAGADRAGATVDSAGREGRAEAPVEGRAGENRAENAVESLAGGRPLPEPTRSFFESRFGRDFGDVRVHTGPRADEAARSIGARAFTHGREVAFSAGEYAPGTTRGRKLLAHELTHVVQQSGSSDLVARQADPDAATVSDWSDRAGEFLQEVWTRLEESLQSPQQRASDEFHENLLEAKRTVSITQLQGMQQAWDRKEPAESAAADVAARVAAEQQATGLAEKVAEQGRGKTVGALVSDLKDRLAKPPASREAAFEEVLALRSLLDDDGVDAGLVAMRYEDETGEPLVDAIERTYDPAAIGTGGTKSSGGASTWTSKVAGYLSRKFQEVKLESAREKLVGTIAANLKPQFYDGITDRLREKANVDEEGTIQGVEKDRDVYEVLEAGYGEKSLDELMAELPDGESLDFGALDRRWLAHRVVYNTWTDRHGSMPFEGMAPTWQGFLGQMQGMEWMGQDVYGHELFLERLQQAENYLRAEYPRRFEAGDLIGDVDSHWRSYQRGQSYHGYGMAIDIDAGENPFVTTTTHTTRRNQDFWIIWRAAWLVGELDDRQVEPFTTEGIAERRSQSTEEIWSYLDLSSRSVQRYFDLLDDPERLEQRVATLGDSPREPRFEYHGEFSKDELSAPGVGGRDSEAFQGLLERWRAVIERDREVLNSNRGGTSGVTEEHGFMNLELELVTALRDEAGLAWGGSDWGHASGDFMHFDMRNRQFNALRQEIGDLRQKLEGRFKTKKK